MVDLSRMPRHISIPVAFVLFSIGLLVLVFTYQVYKATYLTLKFNNIAMELWSINQAMKDERDQSILGNSVARDALNKKSSHKTQAVYISAPPDNLISDDKFQEINEQIKSLINK